MIANDFIGADNSSQQLIANEPGPMHFTFGQPEEITTAYDLACNGVLVKGPIWYEPPISPYMLSRIYRTSTHHGSAIQCKRNLLQRAFKPHPLLTREDFSTIALDFIIFGNCYINKVYSRSGDLIKLEPSKAMYVRRGIEINKYYWIDSDLRYYEFEETPIHIKQESINQEIYGEPDYIGALSSIQLNNESTLFRVRYYKNGSHAGFILYTSAAAFKESDRKHIQKELERSKGTGNFRNLYLHAPNGKKDDVQLIPISDVSTKDDFLQIKDTTRDDILAAHRVPPQLMGIIPKNSGGFGDSEKAMRVFEKTELAALESSFETINDALGLPVVSFDAIFPDSP